MMCSTYRGSRRDLLQELVKDFIFAQRILQVGLQLALIAYQLADSGATLPKVPSAAEPLASLVGDIHNATQIPELRFLLEASCFCPMVVEPFSQVYDGTLSQRYRKGHPHRVLLVRLPD